MTKRIIIIIFKVLILAGTRQNHFSPSELEKKLETDSLFEIAGQLCSSFEGHNACIKDILELPNLEENVTELSHGETSNVFLIEQRKVWKISMASQFEHNIKLLRSFNFGLKVAGENLAHLVGLSACCVEKIDPANQSAVRYYSEMDYYPLGNLHDFIHNSANRQTISLTNWKWSVILQILKAVETIHRSGYVHRTLMPENILMADQFKVTLGGFMTLVPVVKSLGDRLEQKESVYTAVESRLNGYFTQKSDIYSLGMIIFRVFYALNFWSHPTATIDLQTVCSDLSESSIYSAEFLEAQFYCLHLDQLVRSMINNDPWQRPWLKEVRQHIEGLLSDMSDMRKQLHEMVDDYEAFDSNDDDQEFNIEHLTSV